MASFPFLPTLSSPFFPHRSTSYLESHLAGSFYRWFQGHWAAGKAKWWLEPQQENDSAVTLTFTYLATKPREVWCCTTSSVIYFQSLIKRGGNGFKTDRGMGEAEGNRCLKGNCHWGHLQISKWSCDQWEKVVRIKCGAKSASGKV